MSPIARSPSMVEGGVRLGRIAGIKFFADWSLLVIFALIAFSLRFSLFPAWHPNWHPALAWTASLAAAILFLGSVAIHELSHALVARHYGIPVQRITLFLFGGYTQIDREAPGPRVEFWMAIVGPATSVLIGIVATITGLWLSLGAVAAGGDDTQMLMAAIGPVATLLLWLGPINLLLGSFNLLPAFPLDGGRILRATLWWAFDDLTRATFWASAMGVVLSILLMAAGVAMAWGIYLPLFGVGLLPGLWIACIGWFLHSAARSSYQDRLLHDLLAKVKVTDVMRSHICYVRPSMNVMALVRDLWIASDQNCFPVVDGNERMIGLVTESDLKKASRASWSDLLVAEIMTPIDALAVLPPQESAFDALRMLEQHEHIPVVKDSQVLGMVERQDVSKWIAVFAESGAPPR